MNHILSAAIIGLTSLVFIILFKWGKHYCKGPDAVNLNAFLAILFTSGLDMGLIILPLTEFPTYAKEEAYSFASPFVVEFGFWGFFIWSFYFVTSFYFCVIEPKVKLFEKPVIKFVNNVVIIGTCAFTCYLFLENMNWYIPDLNRNWTYLLIGLIIGTAVFSSTHLRYVKWLSLSSTWLFFALIVGMWVNAGTPIAPMVSNLLELKDYFLNIDKFILPINDYHAFYLFWWFSWSIMIGQFVARFISGLSTRKLFLALLILPSIPLAIWFSVLYIYFESSIPVTSIWKISMVVVGILFVINSVDSLIRLYSENLNLTFRKLGMAKYFLVHCSLMVGLVALFIYTPLKIEWIGLIVVALFATIILYLVTVHRKKVAAIK